MARNLMPFILLVVLPLSACATGVTLGWLTI